MERKPKAPKHAGFTRTIVADNLRRALGRLYPQLTHITARQKQFQSDHGVPFTTTQRVCKAERGPNIDTIEQIALALDLSVYQLCVPELDLDNPQVVAGATKAEQRLYSRYQRAKSRKPKTETV